MLNLYIYLRRQHKQILMKSFDIFGRRRLGEESPYDSLSMKANVHEVKQQ